MKVKTFACITLFIVLCTGCVQFEPDIAPLDVSMGEEPRKIDVLPETGSDYDIEELAEKNREEFARNKISKNWNESDAHYEWRVQQEIAYLDHMGYKFSSNMMPDQLVGFIAGVWEWVDDLSWRIFYLNDWTKRHPEPQ